jgi:hypothetical protein
MGRTAGRGGLAVIRQPAVAGLGQVARRDGTGGGRARGKGEEYDDEQQYPEDRY